MDEIKNEAGTCPVCGGENLDYDGGEVDGNNYVYDWECDDCEAQGIEIYKLVFTNHSYHNDHKDKNNHILDEPCVCPKCKGELDYEDGYDKEDISISYGWTCKCCNLEGQEWYDLEFEEMEVN